MVLAPHAEDDVVAGEVDFDHYRACPHLGEKAVHVMFEGDVDAMADAARMGDLDSLADMKRKVDRRNVAEP
jgi:hypothetical protein